METHKITLKKTYSLVLESYSAIFTGVGKIILAALRIILAKKSGFCRDYHEVGLTLVMVCGRIVLGYVISFAY